MAALMKTISSFTSEKVIVDRERSRGCYGTLPYLIGKLVAELPAGAFFPLCFGAVVYPMCGLNTQDVPKKFLNFAATIVVESFAASAMGLCVSAIAPTPEAATAMGPAVMVMFIVFGGYYVNAENVPFAFRWITKCSLIKHSFQGLCLNEFRGLDFESELRGDTKHGEEVLERLGFGNESVENCLAKQTNVLGFCYLATLYGACWAFHFLPPCLPIVLSNYSLTSRKTLVTVKYITSRLFAHTVRLNTDTFFYKNSARKKRAFVSGDGFAGD
jgi:hypothetical protein|tara:strand:+ start:11805 stop:12620 length:816 start_codon:yes stop_codon:yes gene_type:complete